ncbi:MAG: hypothetical protein R3C11_20015 [Planctomycetaceae bacterium]
MHRVNYYILGKLLDVLERAQFFDEVFFEEVDPDFEEEVLWIARKFLEPMVKKAAVENQEVIARTLAFYAVEEAPFREVHREYYRLKLKEPNSWNLFYEWIGKGLFGENFQERYNLADLYETPDKEYAEMIFSPWASGYDEQHARDSFKTNQLLFCDRQGNYKITSTRVNYHIFDQFLSKLEWLCLMEEDPPVWGYDTNSESDIREMVQKYFEPLVNKADIENQEAIIRTFVYYTHEGNLPFQEMADRRQELIIDSPDSWELFFHRIGVALFGDNYRDYCRGMKFTIDPSYGDAGSIFSSNRVENE